MRHLSRLLLNFALAGHVMAVTSSGHQGDQVSLTSILHEFEATISVSFDFRLQESKPGAGGSLSVYLLSRQLVPMRLSLRHWSIDSNTDWQRGCVMIQRGIYHLMFLATLGLPYYSDIYLDNVKVGQLMCHQENMKPPIGNIIFLFGDVKIILPLSHIVENNTKRTRSYVVLSVLDSARTQSLAGRTANYSLSP